jgi:ppGpp synthetase/RelA/SpoT-type nucleotidyltranferase
VTSGDVMSGILAALKEMSQHYAGGNPNLLFFPAHQIDGLTVLQKSFKSAIEKLYRKNVLYNRSYPDAPPDGVIKVRHLYENIDGLLRTRLVCKYMDGPKYVCEQLTEHCKLYNIDSYFRELSTDAGYYAWHFYFKAPVEIMINKTVEETQILVEIQITTQLAEVISSLTHGLYEARRSGQVDTEGRDWK